MASWVERGGRIFLRRDSLQRDGTVEPSQSHVELQIDSKTYEELLRLVSTLQTEWNKRVTIDEAIIYLYQTFCAEKVG